MLNDSYSLHGMFRDNFGWLGAEGQDTFTFIPFQYPILVINRHSFLCRSQATPDNVNRYPGLGGNLQGGNLELFVSVKNYLGDNEKFFRGATIAYLVFSHSENLRINLGRFMRGVAYPDKISVKSIT